MARTQHCHLVIGFEGLISKRDEDGFLGAEVDLRGQTAHCLTQKQ